MTKDKISVLIADDELHTRSLIKMIVSSLGAEVVAEAADGEQALRLYQQFRPDMVMMDVNMPKMDGIKVLKQIMAGNSKALVVMLSALNSVEVISECIENGAWNYILKDATAEELYQEISNSWASYLEAIEG